MRNSIRRMDMDNEKQTKKNLMYFPLGTVGRDAVYCLINSYLLTFVLFI